MPGGVLLTLAIVKVCYYDMRDYRAPFPAARYSTKRRLSLLDLVVQHQLNRVPPR